MVGIERRSFESGPSHFAIDHAGAASDGEALVIVDQSGSPDREADSDLIVSARLRGREASRAAYETLPELPDETRAALRQLGYIE